MTDSFKEIKRAIAWQLRESIGDERFDMWFSTDRSFRIQAGKCIVCASDEFSLSFIRQQFGNAIRQAVNAAIDTHPSIEYIADSPNNEEVAQQSLFSQQQLKDAGFEALDSQKSPLPNQENSTAGRNRPNKRKTTKTALNQQALNLNGSRHKSSRRTKSLNDFQFGNDNALVQTAISQIIAFPGKFNPLVLHGPVGCGKTHLLQAIVGAARRQQNGARCLYLTSEQFTSNFIEALGGRGLTMFRSKYRSIDVFAIDDIQFLSGKRATMIEFQNTIETLMRGGKQIVVAADRPVFELDFLGEQLITRLSTGLACPVEYPDVDGRRKIVLQFAKANGLALCQQIVDLVSQRIARDVRLLSGAVNRLCASQIVSNKSTSLSEAESLLDDLFQTQRPLISMNEIESVVCELCGVQPVDLKSAKRVRRISNARMLAMWLSRKHTSSALAEIGGFFGGRSHSTVIAAQKKVDHLVNQCQEIELRSHKCQISSAIGRLENMLNVG